MTVITAAGFDDVLAAGDRVGLRGGGRLRRWRRRRSWWRTGDSESESNAGDGQAGKTRNVHADSSPE
jgi:hypothetical protein